MKYKQLITLVLGALLSLSLVAQEQAPEFFGPEIHTGETMRLSDFRGKIIYLDFWASWCPPCLLSLPAYEKMRMEIDSVDFEIIAVNVDADTADGLNFLLDTPVSYPVLVDPKGDIGIPYKVRSLPVSYLINGEGHIIKRYRGFEPGDENVIKQDIQKQLNIIQSQDSAKKQ